MFQRYKKSIYSENGEDGIILEILKRLKKRDNFNHKLFNKFKKIQLPLNYKKKKSHYIIKNNFTKKSVIKNIKTILKDIL